MACSMLNITKQNLDFSFSNNSKMQPSNDGKVDETVCDKNSGDDSTLQLRQPKILVVDDNDILLNVHTIFLKQLNCDVSGSETGRIALSSFQQYDLIFLDIGLPDINGIEICRRIRNCEISNKNPRSIPLIALTAYGDDMKEQCLEAGFDDFATKPIEPKIFEQFLKHWLPKHLVNYLTFTNF